MENLSIIIPAYNENATISGVILGLKNELQNLNLENHEIIVVNDGSQDNTQEIVENIPNIKAINHPENKGYGAALKTGIRKAQYEWILLFDADLQHKPEYIKKFIKYTNQYELIAGDRSKSNYYRPFLRKPGLLLLKAVANYLVDYKIPDLNCGMRLIKKNAILNYLNILPNGFSFSTTSTLAFLKQKRNVKFVAVEIEKRDKNSKSTVKPKDAISTLMLIFRLIMLFSPLRIFFPISLVLGLIGLILLVFDILNLNITDITVFILLTSMLIFFFGLIADQIALLRLEINKK